MRVTTSPAGISRTAALTVLANLAERWGVAKTKRHQLLGMPASTVNHWFSDLDRSGAVDDARPLDRDTLERISHLASIYNGLHRLMNEEAADRWISMPNRAFSGRRPLELLISGRFDDLIDVRRCIDRVVAR